MRRLIGVVVGVVVGVGLGVFFGPLGMLIGGVIGYWLLGQMVSPLSMDTGSELKADDESHIGDINPITGLPILDTEIDVPVQASSTSDITVINPATGLPMLSPDAMSVDIQGNPYGVELNSLDTTDTMSTPLDDGLNFIDESSLDSDLSTTAMDDTWR